MTPPSVGFSPTREAAVPWHALSADAVGERLETSPNGLSEAEANRRLGRFGSNLLRPPAPDPWQRILVHQFRSVVVALLVGVFVLALMVGDYLEAVAIGAVLLINTALGFFTELRAMRAMESLKRLQVHGAVAIRGGERRAQDARDLVPGDVLVLEAGSAVAADARIFEARELEVNEAPLTGESLPVAKSPNPLSDGHEGEVPLADRSCMVYKGTFVTAGEGLAYVVGTGRQTEIGRVGELIRSVEAGPTPLERKLAELGRRLVLVALAVALVITVLGIAQGRETWLMVQTGIALAIAAIPEGLPVVATIALAVGLRRMARRNALVRDLHSVEGLGSVTVVCADKTGTLTTGRMAVRQAWVGGEDFVVGEGSPLFMDGEGGSEEHEIPPGLMELIRGAVLASRVGLEGSTVAPAVGDPTEVALHELGSRAGLQHASLSSEFQEVGSVPFSSERMLAASFREANGRTVAHVKGAPQKLLELSSRTLTPTGPIPMDDEIREAVRRKNSEMAADGLRVLAVAQREIPPATALTEDSLESLEFVGLVGIADPPAAGVSETLETLRGAGIVTVMITGDQAPTAEAVAREIGLLQGGDVLTARDLTDLETAELDRVRVFARVTPKDKLAIVRAFQRRGDMVAMVGDGINDAPAMKQADVGVAMGGRGTDVAKETADLVIQDDRLDTVAAAVEEGRVIFTNIRKFVFYLFSCNLSEVGVLALAGFTSLPAPLLPLQILWLNLVTDVFPALALAVEPAEEGVMRADPRDPSAAILSRDFLTSVLGYGVVLVAAGAGAFLFVLSGGADAATASTVAFQTLALSQLGHAFNARRHGPLRWRQLMGNRWMLGAVALTVSLQILAVAHPVLNRVLGTVHITEVPWIPVLAFSLFPLLAGQVWKRIRPALSARVREEG